MVSRLWNWNGDISTFRRSDAHNSLLLAPFFLKLTITTFIFFLFLFLQQPQQQYYSNQAQGAQQGSGMGTLLGGAALVACLCCLCQMCLGGRQRTSSG